MPGGQVEQMGDSGGPEFQFLGAHGGYRQRKMAFGGTKYTMAGGPVWRGVADGKAFKRRTALGLGVTECYRVGSRNDQADELCWTIWMRLPQVSSSTARVTGPITVGGRVN